MGSLMQGVRRWLAGRGQVESAAAMPDPPRPPDPPGPVVLETAPDAPGSFGYKLDWFAVLADASDAPDAPDAPMAVVAALGLGDPRPANWSSGLGAMSADAGLVFVSPPLRGWVLVVGKGLPTPNLGGPVLDPPPPDFMAPFQALAAISEDVQFFGSHRVVGYAAWARARAGRVERVFAYADGTVYANVGAQTDTERDLRFVDLSGLAPGQAGDAIDTASRRYNHEEDRLRATGLDWRAMREQLDQTMGRSYPGEDDPLALAAAWSLDPLSLDGRTDLPAGVGLVCDVPQAWAARPA